MESYGHRSGCHAAHSCPSDTGSYECGDTGNYSQCPGNHSASDEEESKKRSQTQHPNLTLQNPTQHFPQQQFQKVLKFLGQLHM